MGCGCNKKKNAQTKTYSLKDVIIDEVMGRAEKVDEEVFKERVLTCSQCPHLIRPTFQCGKCFCFVRKKAKYAKSQCPLTIEKHGENPRWLAVSEENGPNPMLEKDENSA